MNKQSGFTLIEIIVVLIILGVLAAIALPNLFQNVARSKGAEAIATFSSMKAPLEACGQKNSNSWAACSTTTLGPTGNFYYELAGTNASGVCGSPGYGTSATNYGSANGWCLRASQGGTADTANNIVLSRDTNGKITCTGSGTFAGVC